MTTRPRDGRWQRLSAGVADRDQMVLVIGLAVRTAALITLSCALLFTWRHLPWPGWSALLAAVLAGESAAVAGRWLRRGGLTPSTLALDLPTAAAALLCGRFLDAPTGDPGWTDFPYPYTVMVSITLGLCCTGAWSALLVGSALAAACAGAAMSIDHLSVTDALLLTPGYIVNAVAGWLAAHSVRRTADQVAAARTAAVVAAAGIATARERSRQARELHDRVLQTMETLTRGQTVLDPALRERLTDRAAWLRRFVETGESDLTDDLPSDLDAAVRAVGRRGVKIRLNDVGLRGEDAGDPIAPAPREALVESVHHALTALAGSADTITVRAVFAEHGVLVTVLATGPAAPPSPDEEAELSDRLAGVGGRLTVEPLPYLTLWVPAGGSPG